MCMYLNFVCSQGRISHNCLVEICVDLKLGFLSSICVLPFNRLVVKNGACLRFKHFHTVLLKKSYAFILVYVWTPQPYKTMLDYTHLFLSCHEQFYGLGKRGMAFHRTITDLTLHFPLYHKNNIRIPIMLRKYNQSAVKVLT